MNPEAEKLLKAIIIKEVPALTPGDIEFLKARSSYLTSDQKEKFASVLEIKVEKKVVNVGSGEINLKELKVRGEAVGIKYKVGTKKEDYLKAIKEAEVN